MIQKTKEYYLALPYIIEVTPIKSEEGGGYSACIPLLGRFTCVGDGETYEAAIQDLRATQESLIEGMLAEREEIPEPVEQRAAVKAFPLRIPAELYQQITEAARTAGISMNRYILAILLKHHDYSPLERAVQTVRTEIQQLSALILQRQAPSSFPNLSTSTMIIPGVFSQNWFLDSPESNRSAWNFELMANSAQVSERVLFQGRGSA